MPRKGIVLLALALPVGFLICHGAVAAETQYALQFTRPRYVTGTYSFEVTTQHLNVERWTLFSAQAPSFTWQANTTTTLTPGGEPAEDLLRHRRLLRSVIDVKNSAGKHRCRGEVVFTAQLRGRQLIEREPGVDYYRPGELNGAELKACLSSSPTINFDNEEFYSWLALHGLKRRARESAIDLARRIFLHLRKTLKYEFHSKLDRTAGHVCKSGVSDCAGMSALFVASMRANKQPARIISGRWAKSAPADLELNGEAYFQQHVKAEFFAENVGWIPVDISSSVLHDKSSEGLRHFGFDGGDFLIVHLDYDFEVDVPKQGRKTFDSLQSFRYYTWGTGKLDDAEIKSGWTVTVSEKK